jgi:hypothetical protein
MTMSTVPSRRVPALAVPLGHPDFPDLQATSSLIALLIANPDAANHERATWARAAIGFLSVVARKADGKGATDG